MSVQTGGDTAEDIRLSVNSADFNTTLLTRAYWLYIPTGHGNGNNNRVGIETGGFGSGLPSGVSLLATSSGAAYRMYILEGSTSFETVGNDFSFTLDTWHHNRSNGPSPLRNERCTCSSIWRKKRIRFKPINDCRFWHQQYHLLF